MRRLPVTASAQQQVTVPEGSPSRRALLSASASAVLLHALTPTTARSEETAAASDSVAATVLVQEAAPAPPQAAPASTLLLRDETLAYTFQVPTATPEGRDLAWTTTREPCRYASAAPLAADARQRIVCELVCFKGPLTASVTVGPAPPVLELLGPQETWTPRQIVSALLADRSTGRVSTGQRVSLANLETVSKVDIDGKAYIVFEAQAQGSPNTVDNKKETYRRQLGVLGQRDSFFYMFLLTAPERLWDEVEPLFIASRASFRLLDPTDAYRSPDTPAVQFW